LGELNIGSYVEEDEQTPNYFLAQDGRKIYRLNVVGIIIDKQKQGSITNFLLDDNTGKIIMRCFEESRFINELNVGEVVLVVGKVRKYVQERYLSPEIIKIVDPLWLKVRSLELSENLITKSELKEKVIAIASNNEKEIVENKEKIEMKIFAEKPALKALSKKIDEENEEPEIIEEEIVEEDLSIVKNEQLPAQKIISMIKELDKGSGALIEEIIEKSMVNDTEKVLQKMLEKGDIFQNLPGRVKVL
jgi:RPA family protein